MNKLIIVFSLSLLATISCLAQGTAFNFQGRLNDGSAAAAGNVQLQFKLYDSLTGGTQVGSAVSISSVPLVNGVFSTELDFGASAFNGAARFIEIGVRPAGSTNPYTILSPRQHLSAVPYAAQSGNAAQLAGVDASQYVTTATVGSSFIRNATTAQTGNFNIDGNGIIGGNVGVGTTEPQAKLDVNGTAQITSGGSGGQVLFAAPNGESGMLIRGTSRADIRFDGSTLKLLAGNGISAPISTNGIAVTTSGNVGIGTLAPSIGYRLEVNGQTLLTPGGTGGGSISFGTPNGETGITINGANTSRADIRFNGNSLQLLVGSAPGPPPITNGITIDSFRGRVGIGTPNLRGTKLFVVADADDSGIIGRSSSGFGVFSEGFLGTNSLGVGGTVALCINGSSQIAFCSSSLRYKTDIRPFGEGFNFINQLSPIAYQWKSNKMTDVGFGAEDVAKIDPRFVNYNDKGEVEGVKYDRLSVVFVNAFKEQQTQIERQQKQLEEQQIQLETLKMLVCLKLPNRAICQEEQENKNEKSGK